MSALIRYLSEEHSTCDDDFAEAENAVAAADWNTADRAYGAFRAAMRRHFAHEEDVLFPAFEARTGMTGGPTWVMRNEHQQMNSLMDGMAAALAQRDKDGYLGLSETLLMIMRQHNMKEENILYPMADQALAGQGEELLERMAAV
jgi:hemerythrin-like domain-containing protein